MRHNTQVRMLSTLRITQQEEGVMAAFDDAQAEVRGAHLEEFAAVDMMLNALEHEDINPDAARAFAALAEAHKVRARDHITRVNRDLVAGGEPPAGDGSIGPYARETFLSIVARIENKLHDVNVRLEERLKDPPFLDPETD